jgi:hypothetical protein
MILNESQMRLPTLNILASEEKISQEGQEDNQEIEENEENDDNVEEP